MPLGPDQLAGSKSQAKAASDVGHAPVTAFMAARRLSRLARRSARAHGSSSRPSSTRIEVEDEGDDHDHDDADGHLLGVRRG